MDKKSAQVFLPPRERCFKRLRLAPDGRVCFQVCKNLQGVDEDIAEYGDGSVILCTLMDTISTRISRNWREWTAIWPSPTPRRS